MRRASLLMALFLLLSATTIFADEEKSSAKEGFKEVDQGMKKVVKAVDKKGKQGAKKIDKTAKKTWEKAGQDVKKTTKD
jgi:hypothetical protein